MEGMGAVLPPLSTMQLSAVVCSLVLRLRWCSSRQRHRTFLLDDDEAFGGEDSEIYTEIGSALYQLNINYFIYENHHLN